MSFVIAVGPIREATSGARRRSVMGGGYDAQSCNTASSVSTDLPHAEVRVGRRTGGWDRGQAATADAPDGHKQGYPLALRKRRSAMSLELHFLNVGHGDCTFVEFPSGRLAMVDINNSKSLPEKDQIGLAAAKGLSLDVFKGRGIVIEAGKTSWEDYYRSLLVDPVDYYSDHFAGRSIFRYIQTHPDMDHMSGLDRFFFQEGIELLNFWDTDHNKNPSSTEEGFTSGRYSWDDWLGYQKLRNGRGPAESEHRVLHPLRRWENSYWSEDAMDILSPTAELITAADVAGKYNNASFILKLTYAGRTVILPGDAEGPAQADMLAAFGEEEPRCDVLKAPHHGRQTGYHDATARAMSPSLVICSVGKKPEVDASDEYEALGARVMSTRYNGSIRVSIWSDGSVHAYDHKLEEQFALPAVGAA
jgi:competence protein ComEC